MISRELYFLSWLLYATLLLVFSCLCFAMYGYDKWRAKREGWRVPEKTLQWLALLGGWPGAWLGQQVFRHKTRKRVFQAVFWCIVAVHLLGMLSWLWLWPR